MKIPQRPPILDPEKLFGDPERMRRLLLFSRSPNIDGPYLHWEQLRRKQPIPEGLNSHEEWWLALKLGRLTGQRLIPLVGTNGQPFSFTVPSRIQKALHHIDSYARGAIAAEGPNMASGNPYLARSWEEEAIRSSQLEGAATTRAVAMEMLRTRRAPQNHSERMIANNYKALMHVRATLKSPLTPAGILKIHAIVTEGTLVDLTDSGRLRTRDDIAVVDQSNSTVLHTPPPSVELPGRLDSLCAFANASNDSSSFIHPVIRACLLHFWLAYDHPFVDGNGRTARALFYRTILSHGYWLGEYTSVSRLFHKAHAEYARAFLYSETDDNDATYFLCHHLDTFVKAIDGLRDHMDAAAAKLRAAEALMADLSLNHRQLSLVSDALRRPKARYTVQGHAKAHRIALQTARTDLQGLEPQGLLQSERNGRRREFFAPANLEGQIRRLSNDDP